MRKFTNKPLRRIEPILTALAVMERGLLADEDMRGLTTHQADAVAKQVRRIEKQTKKPELAKAVGRQLGSAIEWPCAVSTSTCRRLVTISSAFCLFLGIPKSPIRP